MSTWKSPPTTLRDYFAGEALAALISEPAFNGQCTPFAFSLTEDVSKGASPPDRYAIASYRMADAMLKAREVGHD